MSTPSDPLTKAEREALRTSFLTDEWESDLFAVVEGIIAAHDAQVRADERQKVEAEVEQLGDERDRAQEHIAYHLRDFRPTADMAATGDLAVDMGAYADRLRARAEKAEAELAHLAALLADEGTVEKVAEAMSAHSRCERCVRAALDALAGLIGGEEE